MSNGFVYCNKCGSQVPSQASFCTKCGNPMTPNFNTQQQPAQNFNAPQQQPAPNYYTQQPVQNQQFNAPPAVPGIAENGKKKKSKRAVLGSVFGVIGAIIVGVIVRFATTEFTSDVLTKLDIDNYVETVNSYEAGVAEDNSYTSDYFGLKIELDENWEIAYDQMGDITGEDLQASKDEKKASLLEQDIPSSQIDTILDNYYFALEYISVYQTGTDFASVNVVVVSDAGADNTGIENYMEDSSYSDAYDFSIGSSEVSTSVTELDGKKVGLIESSQSDISVGTTYLKQYLIIEGDMVMLITIGYTEGCSDVANDLIDNITID